MSIFTIGLSDDRKTPKTYVQKRLWVEERVKSGLVKLGIDQVSNTYRASEFSVCPRMSVLKTKNIWNSIQDASSTLYTSIGDAVHESVQEALYKEGILLFKEFKAKEAIGSIVLSGSCDAIVIDKIATDIFILDIKTTGAIPSAPKKAYKRQIAFYGLLLGIYSMDIFYVSRNVGMPEPKMKNFPVEQEMLRQVAIDIGIASVLKPGELPPRLRIRSDCFYCSFKNRCWDSSDIGKGHLSQETIDLGTEIGLSFFEAMPERRVRTLNKLSRISNQRQWVIDNYEQLSSNS